MVLLSTHLSLSLSLSLCVSSVQHAATEEQHSQLNTDIMLLASLILHANIAELTAQLMSLSYVYLISSDDGSIIMIFVQINILEGRAGYVSMVTFQSLFHIHSIVWQQKQ